MQTRSRMISLCRSLLRQEGMRVPSGRAATFAKRVRALDLASELRQAVEPLLKTHEDVCAQIELVDQKVERAVTNDERVQRLTTVPSVGPVTAAHVHRDRGRCRSLRILAQAAELRGPCAQRVQLGREAAAWAHHQGWQ